MGKGIGIGVCNVSTTVSMSRPHIYFCVYVHVYPSRVAASPSARAHAASAVLLFFVPPTHCD